MSGQSLCTAALEISFQVFGEEIPYKIKKVMSPFKKEWLRVTQKSTQNPKGKKKFFLQQTGQGNILQIVTSVLPLLLALL